MFPGVWREESDGVELFAKNYLGLFCCDLSAQYTYAHTHNTPLFKELWNQVPIVVPIFLVPSSAWVLPYGSGTARRTLKHP